MCARGQTAFSISSRTKETIASFELNRSTQRKDPLALWHPWHLWNLASVCGVEHCSGGWPCHEGLRCCCCRSSFMRSSSSFSPCQICGCPSATGRRRATVMAFEQPPRIVHLDDIQLPPRIAAATAAGRPTVRPAHASRSRSSRRPTLSRRSRREEPIGTLHNRRPERVGDLPRWTGRQPRMPPAPVSPPPPQPKTGIRPHSGIKPPAACRLRRARVSADRSRSAQGRHRDHRSHHRRAGQRD